jgi:hypothetical protein
LNINIFSKYDIIIEKSGSYIDEENSLPDDISFNNYSSHNTYIWDGAKLLNYIYNKLADPNLISIYVMGNYISFETFDVNSGTEDNIRIVAKEIHE